MSSIHSVEHSQEVLDQSVADSVKAEEEVEEPVAEQEEPQGSVSNRSNSNVGLFKSVEESIDESFNYPDIVPGTDVPFIPLDSVKIRLARVDQEIADVHSKYKQLLVSMEENYARLDTEQDEQFQTFIAAYKANVTEKIAQYQKQLKAAKKDRRKLQKYTDSYVTNLQDKVRKVNEERQELLDKLNIQLNDAEQARFGEKTSRERAYQAELQKVRDENAQLSENVANLEKKNSEQAALITSTQEKGANLQAEYLALVLEQRKAKEARDRAKEAYDSLDAGSSKEEAGQLLAQYSAKFDEIERKIQALLEKARAEGVTIALYEQPANVESFQSIIKRFTLATDSGGASELERTRVERDRLRAELETMKSELIAPQDSDDPMVIALKAQMAQLRSSITAAETKIQELERQLAQVDVEDPTEAQAEENTASQLILLTAAKSKYDNELAEKEAERDKLMKELDELRRIAGEAAEAERQLVEVNQMLEDLKTGNAMKEQELKDSLRQRKLLHNQLEDMKGKIRVFCRIRPLNKREIGIGDSTIVNIKDDYTVTCETRQGQLKPFVYDTIFGPESTQTEVFEDTNALIQSAVDGYNVCIFAYGQTGSGKTFTIQGDSKNPGITPRAIEEVFTLVNGMSSHYECLVSCYMVELYLDRLIDLLLPEEQRHNPPPLNIKKDPKGMVTIPEVTTIPVANSKELYDVFELGCDHRKVASTHMNDTSSRSHLIWSVLIDVTNHETNQRTVGKLSLVDLAGSERVKKSGATADKLKEARAINKSLTALGDVISALSVNETHIPYRNNKLTMLMSDSMGGNAKTLMFVNVSPASDNKDETVMSLTYAARVKLITNEPVKNVETREMSKLKAEIMRMQLELKKYKNALNHSGLEQSKIQELLDTRHADDAEEDFNDPKYDAVN